MRKKANAEKPTTYSAELAALVCSRIAEGESLRTVCKMADMPARATVYRWLRENKDFEKMYELATDDRADAQVDEIVAIADEAPATKAGIQKAKLQIYARVEAAQRMKPRKYGRQLQLTGEGGGPVKVSVKDYTGRKKAGDVPAD